MIKVVVRLLSASLSDLVILCLENILSVFFCLYW